MWAPNTTDRYRVLQARFAVCLSGACERHHTIAKDTCPHCYDFDFESGDVLLFDGDVKAQCCHGVLEITDRIVAGAAEALPKWMADRRVSVQWRGRKEESDLGEVAQRAEKEAAEHRARKGK